MKLTRKRKHWPKILWFLTVLMLLVAVTLAGVWYHNEYTLTLELQGDEEIVLAYGEEFEDPGAQSQFWGTYLLRDVQTIPVTVDGEVDTDTVGSYELTYTATISYRDLFWIRTETKQVKRAVHVVDGDAPVITLTHVEGHYTLPGQAYAEEGYSAFDSYDGDLTDQVTVTTDGETVTYSVTDSSGNTVTETRTIFYDDPIAPEIALVGESQITIIEGDAFTDPGCTANDNCDGELTEKITVSGTVDVNVPGTYTLTYTVSDAWGNEVSTERTVIVEVKPTEPPTEPPTDPPPPPPYVPDVPLPPNGKVIYLTFDDGPSHHTARLLDILAEYNVKATFFVVHTSYMDILPRMAQEGHTIAMHAYNHNYDVVYTSDEAYFNDLKRIQDEIISYTGQTSQILRFPGGSSNTIGNRICPGIMKRLMQKVKEMGYRYFDWNVDSNDAGGASTSYEVYCNVAHTISNSSNSSFVVLQHDLWGFSINAVEDIIKWGLANGYTFAALDMNSPECEHWWVK